MKNSKILISFLLILLIAVSVSAVSASSDVDEISSTAENDIVSEDIVVSGDSDKDISDAINNAKAGDTIDLGKNKIYTINNTITVDKAVTLKGDNVIVIEDSLGLTEIFVFLTNQTFFTY